jgi:NADPH:quinone reductase-like Zn-dependent oxidoreductase
MKVQVRSSSRTETTMRAWNVPEAGAKPRLSDLPVPEVTEGTVLVKVTAAGLNALDNGLASGMMAQMIPHEYPLVLGRDVAGTVEATAPGVSHVGPGDEVIGHVLLAPPVRLGTLGEYALLPAAAVAAKPTGLSSETAAAIPLAGAAALAAVDAVDPKPGQVVLVVGASGGVGSYAVQLLAARGATVVATGTQDDTERLKDLGATTVVDYTTADVTGQVRARYPEGVDALIDLVAYAADGPQGLPLDVVRPGGTVASTLGAADAHALEARQLTGANVMAAPTREVIETLAGQVADGTLKADVEQVLPLEQADAGLAALAGGQARGKIIITVNR